MVKLNIMEHEQYKNIYPHEHHAIREFYGGGNKKPLAALLTKENSISLSDGIRQFIADVLIGKIKPHRGKHNESDWVIYQEVEALLDADKSLRLTSNRHTNGVAEIVAEKRCMSKSAVIKAHNSIKKLKKELRENY
ncbi:MAG: hypothetical protein KAI17_16580 [Thiotrichaceae bacterium]|nr:hypothetical protein [Thiotrichaceae bacterium]